MVKSFLVGVSSLVSISAFALVRTSHVQIPPVEAIGLDGEVIVKESDPEELKVLKRAYNRALDRLVEGSLRNMVQPNRSHHVRVCSAFKQLSHVTNSRPAQVNEAYIAFVADEIAKLNMNPTENFFTFVLLARGKSHATQAYFDDGFCEDTDMENKPWFQISAISGGHGHGDNNYKICRRSIVNDRMECQLALNAYCHRNTCN